jgi:DNA helicase HerA-like ATPase
MQTDDNNTQGKLGPVISGSLIRGIDVKLNPGIPIEDIYVGRHVVIKGQQGHFFGLITDISLENTDPIGIVAVPDISDSFVSQVLTDTTTFVKLHIMTSLIISSGAEAILEGPKPAKTIPPHFSPAFLASERDIEIVFGQENEKNFYIGTPLDMETKVCLNTAELVKRSNGIFGKSGTGKTFLTRLMLIGILQKQAGVNLIFDMHNEYGWEGRSEKGFKVKGLKQLFPSKIAIFTLDEESSRRRKVQTDFVVRIGYDEIEPEDIALLRQTLNLTEASVQAVFQLARHFGDKKWLQAFFYLEEQESKDLADKLAIHEATMRNLRRGLQYLKRFKFLVPHVEQDSVKQMLDYLERGMNVVLEFGSFDDYVAYILVANLLSRRIYDRYRSKTEKALAEDGTEPIPLVIAIEEAHRFLNSEMASQTIFGKIAREMRKYNVTLLVIDQRPSGIDDEIMSQLGTKITCLLDNEKDVDSVLAGVSGKSELKYVLSRLETKQQALIFGHAVPMPVVIKTREYGSVDSYKSFGLLDSGSGKKMDDDKEFESLWKDS